MTKFLVQQNLRVKIKKNIKLWSVVASFNCDENLEKENGELRSLRNSMHA